jgi:hypothetical protein
MKNTYKIRNESLIYGFLIIAIFSIYSNVINFSFINYDDTWYVTANKFVQRGLTISGFNWSLTAVYAANWHPLTWMSHMLDVTLYGMNPGAHHLTNLLFHIVNTLLLFSILKRMTTAFWKSAFVAALFALHPVHVESVAWIAERKDVLCTFFLMMTIWSYIRYVEQPERSRYLGVILFFIFSLMSKPMSVTLPFVLLLLDYWPLNRFDEYPSRCSIVQQQGNIPELKQHINKVLSTRIAFLIIEKTPLFAFSAASCLVTFFVQKNWGVVSSLEIFSINQRLANATVAYAHYIWKMLYPFELAVFYPHTGIVSKWKVISACLILIAISLLAFRNRKRRPCFIVGWLWYLGMLIPVIGLVQVGSQAMADRYTYVPYIGLFIMIAWGLPEYMRKLHFKQLGIAIIAGAAILYVMAGAYIQVQYWKNSLILFGHALKVTSDNYLAHNNIANALITRGNLDDAIQHYQKALLINPDFTTPQTNLKHALNLQAKIDTAVGEMYATMKRNPEGQSIPHKIDKVKKSKVKLEEAIEYYQKMLTYQPAYNKENFDVKNLFKAYRVLNEYKKYLSQWKQ